MSVIVGVDPSLASTGLALVDIDHGEWVTGRQRTKPDGGGLRWQARRMEFIATRVLDFATPGGLIPDLVVVEQLAIYGRNSGAGDLAGLWWHIVRKLTSACLRVEVVAASTRAKYATGNGRAGKSDVLTAVRAAHPTADVPNHDVADAVALAALGARRLGAPIEAVERPWMGEVSASLKW